jgi:hypothetical protein
MTPKETHRKRERERERDRETERERERNREIERQRERERERERERKREGSDIFKPTLFHAAAADCCRIPRKHATRHYSANRGQTGFPD